MEGIIKAVCISEKRGTVKKNINEVNVIKDFGLEGDAHAGKWHRQVSFLSADIVDEFNEKGASVIEGDFGENILAYGIDFKKLPVGTKLICNDAKFEITQIGKECHSHCEIYKRVGDCIMPREGIFAKVLESGTIKVGDKIEVIYPEKDMPYMAAVMTLSDKGSRGERVDTSGPRAAEILKEHGFKIVEEILLPDEEAQIKKHLIRLSDSRQVDLISSSPCQEHEYSKHTPIKNMNLLNISFLFDILFTFFVMIVSVKDTFQSRIFCHIPCNQKKQNNDSTFWLMQRMIFEEYTMNNTP